MKSVTFRRFVLLLIVAVIVLIAITLGSFLILGTSQYEQNAYDELASNAEVISQIYSNYIAGAIKVDIFKSLISTVCDSEHFSMMLLNESGKEFYNYNYLDEFDMDVVNRLINDEFAKNNLQLSQINTFKFYIDGKEIIGYSIPTMFVDSENSIVAFKHIDINEDTAYNLNRILLIIISISAPLVILFSLIRMRSLVKPIKNITDVAVNMSMGNLDVQADQNEKGEFGTIAIALNELSRTLQESFSKIMVEKSNLNKILQSMSDGVVALDNSGEITHINPAVIEMFGIKSEVKEKHDISDNEDIWSAFDRALNNNEAEILQCNISNGRALLVSISPIEDENNNVAGVVGLFKDVTEMERLEKMRSEYIANVSHELRTPLTSMRGLLEPLVDNMVKSEDDKQRYYRIMLHEVERLSRLISDMMMLTKLQSGIAQMNEDYIDLTELLFDIENAYSKTAKSKGIELVSDITEVERNVVTDGDRIEQVLVILIDNAMKFTGEGGKITIAVDEDDEKYIVSVSDTGCGVSEEDLPYLFERFYRADKSRSKSGGSGLGLSIAKNIMLNLGEDITATSELGKGTTFTFTLKKAEEDYEFDD